MNVPIKYWKDSEGRAKWTYLLDRAPEGSNLGESNLRFFRFDKNIKRSIARGYSVNHANGTAEAGLSSYWLEDCTLSSRNEIVPAIEKEWNATGFLRMNGDSLTLWEIEGTICGYGSDGEPLLQNVKVIRKVK